MWIYLQRWSKLAEWWKLRENSHLRRTEWESAGRSLSGGSGSAGKIWVNLPDRKWQQWRHIDIDKIFKDAPWVQLLIKEHGSPMLTCRCDKSLSQTKKDVLGCELETRHGRYLQNLSREGLLHQSTGLPLQLRQGCHQYWQSGTHVAYSCKRRMDREG